MDGKHEVPALTGDTDLEFDHQDQGLDLTVRLALSDLLPDANGEIVVMNDGAFLDLGTYSVAETPIVVTEGRGVIGKPSR